LVLSLYRSARALYSQSGSLSLSLSRARVSFIPPFSFDRLLVSV